MKKLFAACTVVLILLSFCGCDEETEKADLPFNEYAYENRDNSEFIPGKGVVEHGNIVEPDDDDDGIPSEDELGEYQEIFLEGDIFDDGTVAGWVLSISLKDITVNTYNEITKYTLVGNAKNCVEHVVPGDAVLVYYFEDEQGNRTAFDVARVRVEDEPLTRDEIMEMYETSGQGENE